MGTCRMEGHLTGGRRKSSKPLVRDALAGTLGLRHLTFGPETLKIKVKYPDDFAVWDKNGDRVTELVSAEWPTAPADLPNITDNDRLTVLVVSQKPTREQRKTIGPGGVAPWAVARLSEDEITALAHDGEPPYLVMRFAKVIPKRTLEKLLRRWDALKGLAVKYPPADHRRSDLPAMHLGVWELFALVPRITADSIQSRQRNLETRAEVVDAMDALCKVIRQLVVPKLERLMDIHVPGQRRVQERIHARVRELLASELMARPDMDFGGLFYTVAVKEGSSERIHIDWNDNLHKYALIFCTGDYTGGEFCVPQLGVRVPLGPGSVIAARTRLLAHCSAALSGRRVVFTCFTDSTLLEHTLQDRDYAVLQ